MQGSNVGWLGQQPALNSLSYRGFSCVKFLLCIKHFIIKGEEEAGMSEDHDESGLSSADPLLGVQAKKPKDFQVFINLVDFCK